MAGKGITLTETCGRLDGMSHSIRLRKEGDVCLLEVGTAEGPVHVFGRRPEHVLWTKELRLGAFYRLTQLRRHTSHHITEDGEEVFIATRDTKICQEPDVCFTPQSKPLPRDLIMYKGVVEAADSSQQLFRLDGDMQLLLAPIAGISGCPLLEVGDTLLLQHVHYSPALRRITACGRSSIQVTNREADVAESAVTSDLHTFHTFTLVPAALQWYKQTLECIAPAIADTRVPRRGRGSVLQLLMHQAKPPQPPHSLINEFMSNPHRCIVQASYTPPFVLADLRSLVSDMTSSFKAAPATDPTSWEHGTCSVDQRLVARLEVDAAGRPRLRVGDLSTPLLVLGEPPEQGLSDGSVVCLRKCRLVWERLFKTPPDVYVMAHWSDVMLNIPPPTPESTQPRTGDHPQLMLLQRSSAWVSGGRATPHHRCYLHGRLREAAGSRAVLIVVSGPVVPRCAPLRRGFSYHLQSSDKLWTVRGVPCGSCGDSAGRLFADCTLLRAPDDIAFSPCSQHADDRRMVDVSRTQLLSVCELNRERTVDDQLLSVRATVLERSYTRDRTCSRRPDPKRPLDTRKLILRLGGANDVTTGGGSDVTGDEVMLYVLRPTEWASLCALLPGATVEVHGVRWAGQQAATYLVTTEMSDVVVMDYQLPTLTSSVKRPRLHLPLRTLLCAAGSGPGARWLCVGCVADVRRVSLDATCPLCRRAVSAGTCSFVGCHANRPPTVTARATVTLDDGSAQLLVRLVGETVRQILNATDAQWTALTTEAQESPHGQIFHLQPARKSTCPVSLLSMIAQSAGVRRPIVCELKTFNDTTNYQPHSATGRPVITVFCEAVAEASAAVVLRLFPRQPRQKRPASSPLKT